MKTIRDWQTAWKEQNGITDEFEVIVKDKP